MGWQVRRKTEVNKETEIMRPLNEMKETEK